MVFTDDLSAFLREFHEIFLLAKRQWRFNLGALLVCCTVSRFICDIRQLRHPLFLVQEWGCNFPFYLWKGTMLFAGRNPFTVNREYTLKESMLISFSSMFYWYIIFKNMFLLPFQYIWVYADYFKSENQKSLVYQT